MKTISLEKLVAFFRNFCLYHQILAILYYSTSNWETVTISDIHSHNSLTLLQSCSKAESYGVGPFEIDAKQRSLKDNLEELSNNSF